MFVAHRRRLLAGIAGAVCLSALPAFAQDAWPSRQVTLVVPFTAVGTTDMFGRILAQYMQAKFGPPFVVENRAGAGGNVGTLGVARAPGDGYTLLVGTVSTHAINPFLYRNLQHDTEKDFQPVSLIARLPNMLVVHPKIAATTTAEFIAFAKANPGKLSYGSSGAGTSTHLAAELFQTLTGTTMTHVPYRSSGDVMNNLAGGHIDLAFDNMTLAWPQAQAGTIRALGVTSAQRSPAAPQIPAIAEALPGFEATSWHGLFVPASTPKPVVDALAAEVKRILDLPEVQKKLSDVGAVPSANMPAEFKAFIATERDKWEKVVKASGVKVE
jgi:tripartite-type tricarboxylate transporter receptor subunit TctC